MSIRDWLTKKIISERREWQFISVCLFVFGIYLLPAVSRVSKSIDGMIQNSREVETVLLKGRDFTNSWYARHGNFPSSQDLNSAIRSEHTLPIQIRTDPKNYPDPDEVIKEFGQPPSNSYLLSIWRGEWDEYYASWANRTSLNFERSSYCLFGSELGEKIATALPGLILILISIFLLRWASRLTT